MLIFDCHADTLGKWTDNILDTHFKMNEIKPPFIQVFAAFIGEEGDTYARVSKLIDTYDSLAGFKRITSLDDIKEDAISSVLSVEGGDAIGGDIERLKALYKRGVRILTLTWNYDNAIAGAALGGGTGLTPFGREVINFCEKNGITVDLSHASDETFYDVLALSKKPVTVSHSNLRELCGHKRNITKDEFRLLIKNGGVAGVNFYPPFLNGDRADMNDILRHIDAFLSLGGEDSVGIGTDFDGIGSLPGGIYGTRSLYTLCEKLITLYGDNVAEKIMGQNFLRVLRANLR